MDAKTRLCAVIGNPIGHSLSPQIHNAAFAELGLNYAYVAFEVEDVPAAIQGVRALGIAGLSVTIPHKVATMLEVDEVDPVAQDIGCVNTVVNHDGILSGYNTDGFGALNALLAAGCDLDGRSVLILGSGGAARAIAITLAHKCLLEKMTILGVIEEERSILAEQAQSQTCFAVEHGDLTAEILEETLPQHDVLIHCTPVGMYPKTTETVVPESLLRPELWVFDVVYNPFETTLLKQAKARGCQVVPGVEMFVRQAVTQFELWTGQEAPIKVMFDVVVRALENR